VWPADQRVQFSAEEVKRLNSLNEKIGSKLYTLGISMEQWMNSLTKDKNAMLSNLKVGLSQLKLNFNSEEMDLLIRKYNASLHNSGRINFSEFSHLFPKRKLDPEDMKKN